MTKEEVETYLENIRAFLKSEKAQVFSNSHFEHVVAEAILDKN